MTDEDKQDEAVIDIAKEKQRRERKGSGKKWSLYELKMSDGVTDIDKARLTRGKKWSLGEASHALLHAYWHCDEFWHPRSQRERMTEVMSALLIGICGVSSDDPQTFDANLMASAAERYWALNEASGTLEKEPISDAELGRLVDKLVEDYRATESYAEAIHRQRSSR